MPLTPERERRMLRSPGPRYSGSRGDSAGPPGYKVLCVSALHPKASDDVVRDTLYREYKKFGDISVRVMQEPDERVAYVYFRNFEDARDARHSKSRIILFDKPAMVEPIYESRSETYRPRQRSITPPPGPYPGPPGRYRSRSPLPDRDRYHRDYRDDYPYYHRDRGHRSHMGGRGHHHGGRGGFGDYGGGYHERRREFNKKDKFPNYLDHKPPEDDPLATRTLFTGNLELDITEEEMRRIFGRYGKLVDVDIKRPPPGTGNAYAFIRYENLDQAHRAKVELSGQYIGKFQCKIGYGKVNATPKVWVGGLGSWTSLSLLEREFDRFGAIQKIEYKKGDPHAFIFYETLEAAQAAVQEMRGFPLGGPEKRIRIDYSDLEDYSGLPASKNEDSDHYRGGGRGKYPYSSSRGGPSGRGGYDHSRPRYEVRPAREGDDRSPSKDKKSPTTDKMNSRSECKSIPDLCKFAPKCWEGGLILKSSLFPSKFHLIEGSSRVTDQLKDDKGMPMLKITQRLRLDQSKLDDVSRRMNSSSSHAVFVCVSTANAVETDNPEVQSRPLRNLISYLKQKEAAGVITLTGSSESDVIGVLYCFPPCVFSYDLLKREAPFLPNEESSDDHLVILVVCGNS